MKLIFKSIILLSIVGSLAMYEGGCSSAEETTGKLAFQQGDYQKAEKEFNTEIKQNPNNEEAWYYLGATEIMLNKFDEAKKAFEEYRKIGKNTYSSEITDAWIKRFNNGADKFEAAQKNKDPKEQVKLYQGAINDFKTCLIIQPDSVVVNKYIKQIDNKMVMVLAKPYIDKGVDLLNQEKYEDAVTQFKLALDNGLDKENSNYYVVAYDIGLAYLKWGEKIRIANQETNPDDLSYKDKYKEALPFLETLTESTDKKDQLQAYELLVQVYGNLNMTDKALDAIKKRDELKNQ